MLLFVSIPHRYGKNAASSTLSELLSAFPFLIGTVRTCATVHKFCYLFTFPFLIGTVRTSCCVIARLYAAKFPFLIGTVRTRLLKHLDEDLVLFPFLIGTVRTVGNCRIRTRLRKFPFLIGTVRTEFLKLLVIWSIEVSIPHRYGKNETRDLPSHCGQPVFPFLIGTVRTLYPLNYHVSYT